MSEKMTVKQVTITHFVVLSDIQKFDIIVLVVIIYVQFNAFLLQKMNMRERNESPHERRAFDSYPLRDGQINLCIARSAQSLRCSPVEKPTFCRFYC